MHPPTGNGGSHLGMLLQVFSSSHFYKMIGYFSGASALALLLGVFISAGGFLPGLVSAVIIGAVALVFGLGSTIALRAVLGLMQTGRIIQYLCFIAGTWLGIGAASLVVSSLVVTSGFWASLLIFAVAFGAATLVGEVPWKGRTWLPKQMPTRK